MARTHVQRDYDRRRAAKFKAVHDDLRALFARQQQERKLAATVSPYLQMATDTGPFSDEAAQ